MKVTLWRAIVLVIVLGVTQTYYFDTPYPIKENYGELATLAFNLHNNDKYRSETCCTVGNYYSLRGDHHKAVIYF